jgi:hypothetical protein
MFMAVGDRQAIAPASWISTSSLSGMFTDAHAAAGKGISLQAASKAGLETDKLWRQLRATR